MTPKPRNTKGSELLPYAFTSLWGRATRSRVAWWSAAWQPVWNRSWPKLWKSGLTSHRYPLGCTYCDEIVPRYWPKSTVFDRKFVVLRTGYRPVDDFESRLASVQNPERRLGPPLDPTGCTACLIDSWSIRFDWRGLLFCTVPMDDAK
jgi:hypothetical protein